MEGVRALLEVFAGRIPSLRDNNRRANPRDDYAEAEAALNGGAPAHMFGLEPNWAADKYVQFFKDHLEVTSWLHDLGLLKGGVANSLLMTHPLFCRFKNRQVENAFAIYKANSSMSTLHLLLTVALGLLTVGSLVVAPMFNDVVDRRYIDKWTQVKISTFTLLVYGRRVYQLMHRQHRVYMVDEGPPLHRMWRNFWGQHYMVTPMLCGVIGEMTTDPRMSMSLYVLISSVTVLVASSLRVACALAYVSSLLFSYFAYMFYVVARKTETEVDSAGVPMLSTLACIVMGLVMVYYIVRTEEMVLRDQFKAQHLADFLFISAQQEQIMADELIAGALPYSISRHVTPENSHRPTSLDGSQQDGKGDKNNTSGTMANSNSHSYGHKGEGRRPGASSHRHSGQMRSDLSTSRPTSNSFEMITHTGGRRRASMSSRDYNNMSVESVDSGLGASSPSFQPLVGPWAFPNKRRVQALMRRYRARLPPPVHPCRTVRMFHSSAMVQRKFCTVLVAHFLKDSHLRAPRFIMETVLDEINLCVAQHRVEIIPTTGCSIRAACGITDTWGSARRDARAIVAMASDLIAITETLGLEVCVGINSGSMVAALDCLSPSLYDLLGNTVSSAVLLADVAVPGQIILDEASYQLIVRDQLDMQSSRVLTHHLKVRLLNGVRDTYAAVSNPFSISWWFTSRRQEVLTKLQSTRKVDGAYTNTMSRTMGSAPAGDGTRRWVGVGEEDLEAGLGPGVQMREKKKTVEPLLSKMAKEGPFAQKVVHPLDVYSQRLALDRLCSMPSLMPNRPHTVSSFSDVATHLLAPLVSSLTSRRLPQLQLQRCRERYALQPIWELNFILIIIAATANIWTFRPDAFSIVPLFLLYPLDLVLQRRPRSLVIFLIYALGVALVVVSLSIDRDPYPVANIRMMLMMGPALYLPTLQSLCLAAEVYVFTRANRLIFWARTGGNNWVLERILCQSGWLLPLMLVLLAVKCHAELCVATIYLDMYPCLRRLQRIRQALMTRTDEIIKSVVPFPLTNEDVKLLQKRETLAAVLPAHVVVLHIEVDSLRNVDGLILPIQLFALQRKIFSMLEGAIRLSSATPLFHTGQTYVAACGLQANHRQPSVPATPEGLHGRSGLGNSNDPVVQAIELATYIRCQIKEFNVKHRVSLSVKMGIARGPVLLSWCLTPHMDASGLAVGVAKALALQTRSTAITTDMQAHVLTLTQPDRTGKKPPPPPQALRNLIFSEMEAVTVFGQEVECVEMKIDSEGSDLLAAPKVEDFEVLGLLGSGGYGSVHLAREPQSGTLVAVKVMLKRPKGVSAPMRVELNVLAQVQHPNVVHFYYCLQSASKIYLVMEYIPGGTLKRVLKDQKPPMSVLRMWFAELTLALGYLHCMHVIHRDIKPENIMISEKGHLKVTDFGLAKVIKAKGVARTGEMWQAACGDDMVHLMQRLMPTRSLSNSNYSGGSHQWGSSGGLRQSSTGSVPPSDIPGGLNPPGFLGQGVKMPGVMAGIKTRSLRPRYRVLVVEDEPLTRFVTRAVLKGMGFEPTTVPDGKRALERLHASMRSTRPIDLVLLDLDLPVMTGPQLLREIQADLHLRRIPVVVLSSEDRMKDITACMELGAKEYFCKPLRADMVNSLLKYAKDRRREAVKAMGGDTTLHEEEGLEEEEDGEGLEDVEAGHGGGGRPAEQKVRGEEKKAPTGILKKKRVGGKRHNLRQPSDWATYLEDAFPHDRRGGRGARGKGRRADGEGFLTPVRPAKGALNDYYDEHEEHDHDDDDEDEEEGGGEEDEEEEDDEYLFSPEEAAFEGAGAEGAQQTADTWVSQDRYSIVGTPYYMSPEMVDRQPYGPAVDYWALGVLIFEAVTGTLPFTGENPRAVFAAIRKLNVPWQNLRKAKDPLLESLVVELLNPNHTERADYMQVRKHPYFAGLKWDSLSTMETGFKPVVQLPKSMSQSARRKLCRSSNDQSVGSKDQQSKNGPEDGLLMNLTDMGIPLRSAPRDAQGDDKPRPAPLGVDGGHDPSEGGGGKPQQRQQIISPTSAPRLQEQAVNSPKLRPQGQQGGAKGGAQDTPSNSNRHSQRQSQMQRRNSNLSATSGGLLSSLSITLSSRLSSRRRRSSSRFYQSSPGRSDSMMRHSHDEGMHSMGKPTFDRDKWLALLYGGDGSDKPEKSEDPSWQDEAEQGSAGTGGGSEATRNWYPTAASALCRKETAENSGGEEAQDAAHDEVELGTEERRGAVAKLN